MFFSIHRRNRLVVLGVLLALMLWISNALEASAGDEEMIGGCGIIVACASPLGQQGNPIEQLRQYYAEAGAPPWDPFYGQANYWGAVGMRGAKPLYTGYGSPVGADRIMNRGAANFMLGD